MPPFWFTAEFNRAWLEGQKWRQRKLGSLLYKQGTLVSEFGSVRVFRYFRSIRSLFLHTTFCSGGELFTFKYTCSMAFSHCTTVSPFPVQQDRSVVQLRKYLLRSLRCTYNTGLNLSSPLYRTGLVLRTLGWYPVSNVHGPHNPVRFTRALSSLVITGLPHTRDHGLPICSP